MTTRIDDLEKEIDKLSATVFYPLVLSDVGRRKQRDSQREWQYQAGWVEICMSCFLVTRLASPTRHDVRGLTNSVIIVFNMN